MICARSRAGLSATVIILGIIAILLVTAIGLYVAYTPAEPPVPNIHTNSTTPTLSTTTSLPLTTTSDSALSSGNNFPLAVGDYARYTGTALEHLDRSKTNETVIVEVVSINASGVEWRQITNTSTVSNQESYIVPLGASPFHSNSSGMTFVPVSTENMVRVIGSRVYNVTAMVYDDGNNGSTTFSYYYRTWTTLIPIETSSQSALPLGNTTDDLFLTETNIPWMITVQP